MIDQAKFEATMQRRAAKYAEAQKFAQSMHWPQLVGSPKQVAWAEVIRFNFLARAVNTKAKVRELLKVLPQNQLEAALTLFERNTSAKWWIDTNTEYGSLKTCLQERLDSEPSFVFELMFEEQMRADMDKMTPAPTPVKSYVVEVNVASDMIFPPTRLGILPYEEWLDQQDLIGKYDVNCCDRVYKEDDNLLDGKRFTAVFTFTDERDAVMFKLRWSGQ